MVSKENALSVIQSVRSISPCLNFKTLFYCIFIATYVVYYYYLTVKALIILLISFVS